MKEKLVHAPILRGPNWSLPFHISSDASDLAIGVALGQEENKKSYAIYYISKNLSSAELNYTVTEKEFLAIILQLISSGTILQDMKYFYILIIPQLNI